MAKSVLLSLTADQHAAIAEHLAGLDEPVERAAWMRRILMAAAGRPDLADQVARGRPRSGTSD